MSSSEGSPCGSAGQRRHGAHGTLEVRVFVNVHLMRLRLRPLPTVLLPVPRPDNPPNDR